MSGLVRTIWFVVGVGLVPALMWVSDVAPRHDRPVVVEVGPGPVPAAGGSNAREAVGIGGCLAGGCHGGAASAPLSGPVEPRWPSSATHWLALDPHTRAYAALEGEQAARIMSRLGMRDERGRPVAATESARCLACHTNPALAGDGPPGATVRALREHGVSCEACHGNAGIWLHDHTGWTATTRPAGYAAAGMVPLYDLGERAITCAGCHVGAPADPERGYPVRDMNHDMIAAGHPRLNFDFADYQHRLPAHWNERDRTHDGTPAAPDFEARAWLVGRVAHAEAACRLLADRAGRSTAAADPAPWPEFAEISCFSCHHDLQPDSWRQNRERGTRPVGTPRWQSIWPITRHLEASAGAGGPQPRADAANRAVTALLETVQVANRPRSDTAGNRALAAAATLRELRQALTALPGRDAGRAAVAVLARVPVDQLDWDEMGQVLGGLAALERTRLGQAPRGTRVNPGFEPAFRALSLPRPPRDDRWDSPRRFIPADAKAALNGLLRTVPDETAPVLK